MCTSESQFDAPADSDQDGPCTQPRHARHLWGDCAAWQLLLQPVGTRVRQCGRWAQDAREAGVPTDAGAAGCDVHRLRRTF